MATSNPRKQFSSSFGGSLVDEESIERDLEDLDDGRLQLEGDRRPSAYVEVFERTIEIVLEHEPWLLSSQEVTILEAFSKLRYHARYCLVRLVLRKANQWHAVSALEKYEKEIGKGILTQSIADLCQPIEVILKGELVEDDQVKIEPPDPPVLIKQEVFDATAMVKTENEPDIIDLTMDTDDEEEVKPDMESSTGNTPASYLSNEPYTSRLPMYDVRIQSLLHLAEEEINLDCFCDDETVMALDEILWRLNKDQLMKLVKDTKCQLKKGQAKKSEIITALQYNASTQSVLKFRSTTTRKGKSKDNGLRQTCLSFGSGGSSHGTRKMTQEARLREMALTLLGKCVRVNFDFYRLIRRIHIICYRETEHPQTLLLPALLATFKKRFYTNYEHTRSNAIWSSREELLAYEKALELESLLNEVVEGSEDKPGRKGTKTPARGRDQTATPMPGRHHTTPLKTPSSICNIRVSKTPGVKTEDGLLKVLGEEEGSEEKMVVEIRKEEMIKQYLEASIYPKWKEHIAGENARETPRKPPGLERFESGYIFTRILHNFSKAYGSLKEYDAELEVIESLLAQTSWRRGKRSVWYERRAIILGHLHRQAKSDERKIELLWRTLDGVREALLDPDTGIVWRPSLVRRLFALEKRLKIPPEERSSCEGALRTAIITELHATKIPNPNLKLDTLGRPVDEKENTSDTGIQAYMQVTKKGPVGDSKPEEQGKKKFGKSNWKGRNDQIVNVETRALQLYEDQGFKGFHCETKILTTIFGLLFWDIIFASVPGAFETPYQTAPLDMSEESFYHARKHLIDKRLGEIKDGGWRKFLQRHDDAYRETQTWCIGVSWDLCSKEDLFEIFECIGEDSLTIICQLFCEDYKGRSSGGPDLFIWNAQQCTCKFVEVKGPGDRPQENQRYWFDSLLRAKVDVEICKVIDDSAPPFVVASSKKRKAKTPSTTSRDDSFSEEEDYDRLDPEPGQGADTPNPSLRRKRRCISAGNTEDMHELPCADTSSSSSFRKNRAEVLLTPSKRKIVQS